jgi:hypothetical protein
MTEEGSMQHRQPTLAWNAVLVRLAVLLSERRTLPWGMACGLPEWGCASDAVCRAWSDGTARRDLCGEGQAAAFPAATGAELPLRGIV